MKNIFNDLMTQSIPVFPFWQGNADPPWRERDGTGNLIRGCISGDQRQKPQSGTHPIAMSLKAGRNSER